MAGDALQTAREVMDAHPDISAEIYYYFGNCCDHLGNYAEAINQYTQSLESYNKAIKHHPKHRKQSLDRLRRDQGAAHGSLGNCYDRIGKHHDAFEHLKEALSIVSSLSKEEDNLLLQGHVCNWLGEHNDILGKCDMAINYFKQSLTISKDLGKCKVQDYCYKPKQTKREICIHTPQTRTRTRTHKHTIQHTQLTHTHNMQHM